MKKTLIFAAVATAGMIAAPSAQAALAADAQLLMGPQDGFCDFDLGTYPDACVVAAIPSANYFAMDSAGDGFDNSDRVAIEAGLDGGILLGVSQMVTSEVIGVPGSIDVTWNFFGNPGNHIQDGTISVATAAGNTATINMTGWTVFWGDPTSPDRGAIDMGTGADAVVTCGVDCGLNDTFTLDYTAVVPSGAFQGVAYQLHLTGTIGGAVIPVPAAVWLFGSGLLGLVGVARRRKAA